MSPVRAEVDERLRPGSGRRPRQACPGGTTTAQAIAAVRYDLIDLRNAHLLAELETSLDERDVVVVPWGALHLPGIEQGVQELGFALNAETDRRVISW